MSWKAMRHCLAALVLFWGGCAFAALSASPRLALVIGVSDYNRDGDIADTDPEAPDVQTLGQITDLPNPVNDAADVADALRRLGFDVSQYRDLDKAGLEDAVIAFGEKVSAAGPDAIVLFYFAGHGVQVNGMNFLIPAGARLPRADLSGMSGRDAETLLARVALPTTEVLDRLSDPSPKGLNIIVLDACRNNPWDRRIRGLARGTATRGLADMPVALRRTMVAFSTQPGNTAADGNARNSPYAASLYRRLGQAGVTVREMFDLVGEDVERATSSRQIPFVNTPSIGNICLTACAIPSARLVSLDSPLAGPGGQRRWNVSNHDLDLALSSRILSSAGLPARYADARAAAERGDAFAAFLTGLAFEEGVGVAKNPADAARWYRRSAELGDPFGMVSFAQALLTGDGIEADPASATQLLRRAVTGGNDLARVVLGMAFLEGAYVPRDKEEAMRLFAEAASHGDANAIALLALAKVNVKDAATLENALAEGRRAAEAGSPVGDWVQGLVLIGKGQASAAIAPLRRAAADIDVANVALARALLLSGSVPEKTEARRLLFAAANAGSSEAMLMLSEIATNDEEFVRWATAAMNKGEGEAAVSLTFYQLNRGAAGRTAVLALVPKLKELADQGDIESMAMLGHLLVRGDEGVAQNADEGVKLLRRAADAGSGLAQLELGLAYSKGLGVVQNYEMARRLFKQASDGGDSNAMVRLASLYARGQGGPADPAEAARLLRRAAERGNLGAETELARVLEEGDGVAANPIEAASWISRAAEAGDAFAMLVHGDNLQKKGRSAEAQDWKRRGIATNDGVAFGSFGLRMIAANRHAEAVDWLRRSVAAGDPILQSLLADEIWSAAKAKGGPSAQEAKEIVSLYEAASAREDNWAKGRLARIYATGELGTTVNVSRAITLAEQASQAGGSIGSDAVALLAQLRPKQTR